MGHPFLLLRHLYSFEIHLSTELLVTQTLKSLYCGGIAGLTSIPRKESLA